MRTGLVVVGFHFPFHLHLRIEMHAFSSECRAPSTPGGHTPDPCNPHLSTWPQCCLFGGSPETKVALMATLVQRSEPEANEQPIPSTSYDTAVGTVERPDGTNSAFVSRRPP